VIGYKITRRELEKLVKQENATWLKRASDRTAGFIAAKTYSEKSSMWSEIKSVYMTLQGESKCAFCERKLESVEIGKIEQDVEHFRPKNRISAWAGSSSLTAAGVVMSSVPAGADGYYGLAYDLFNYAASCKPCNSVLKNDYFPIAGNYDFAGLRPEKMGHEKPLLLYPIGSFDKDPETLIEFFGVSPRPVSTKPHDRHRALVTIEFFKLDDVIGRKNLIKERANIIIGLYVVLESLNGNRGDTKRLQRTLTSALGSHAPHANCARSFHRLYVKDRAKGQQIYEAASDLLDSMSP